MSDGTALIAARNLVRRDAASGQTLLHDIQLRLDPGARIALLGPNGSGKSLLLRSLCLLDPIDEGEILWHGKPIADRDVPKYRRAVVYLHQRPALRDGTVEDNLKLPFELDANRECSFDRDRALGLLEQAGLGTAFLRKSALDLSGGEAQLVAALRALQLDPEVLLLDESTAALDVSMVETFEQLIAGWMQAHAGRASIWITHQPEQVERVADRTWTMSAGTLHTEEP